MRIISPNLLQSTPEIPKRNFCVAAPLAVISSSASAVPDVNHLAARRCVPINGCDCLRSFSKSIACSYVMSSSLLSIQRSVGLPLFRLIRIFHVYCFVWNSANCHSPFLGVHISTSLGVHISRCPYL